MLQLTVKINYYTVVCFNQLMNITFLDKAVADIFGVSLRYFLLALNPFLTLN